MSPRVPSRLVAVAGTLLAASWSLAQGLQTPHPEAQKLRPAPVPIIDECRCSATVFERSSDGGLTTRFHAARVTDVDDPSQRVPRDTCPAAARIDIEWHSEPQAIEYRHRLSHLSFPMVEPDFVLVRPGVTVVSYHTGIPPDTSPLAPGIKVFTLGARGPKTAFQDSTRRFQVNYSPDTWFSGPDLGHPVLQTHPESGEKYVTLVGGKIPQGITGSGLSEDSTLVLPALRPQRKSFFEIWEDTVFARQEGDTVHMNSWIVLYAGGFDRDSEYRVQVSPLARDPEFFPNFPGGPVLEPGPANGSPTGFRSAIAMSLTPAGFPLGSSFRNVYPVFDPNSVFHEPRLAGYHAVIHTGRAFALMQAQDGDSEEDRRISDPAAARDLVIRVENGTATPEERALRDKVLTFHVNKPPYLVDNPTLRPRLSVVDTFYSSLWDLRLPATDLDPYYPPNSAVGGPSSVVTLRRKVTIRGQDASGRPFVHEEPSTVNQQNINVQVPAGLAAGACTVEVELCDCALCEDFPGSGRCVTYQIPVYYQPSAPAQPASINTSRPGSEPSRPRSP